MIFAYFKKAVSVWAVNLLESLGIHFIILISPDNLKSQAILMELGQILFRLLFLYYIAVSQDLKEIKLRENDKIPLHSMRGFRMLGFDFTHFPFFFFSRHICVCFPARTSSVVWGLRTTPAAFSCLSLPTLQPNRPDWVLLPLSSGPR